MELREEHPQQNFFRGPEILEIPGTQRDTKHHPRVVQAWDFLRKFVSDSDRLDWSSEAARRATMRDVESAAEDCGVSTALNSPQTWSVLVCMMNMPEKLQEALVKKLQAKNSASIYSDLCIPTPAMCDAILHD